MGINTTVIPSRIDASATDGEYVTTNDDDKLTLGSEFFKQQAETEIEIIELQANASVTPIDHDTLVSDTFSDTTGYENTVNTGNTTAVFDTNKYERNNSDGTETEIADGLTVSGSDFTEKIGWLFTPSTDLIISKVQVNSVSNDDTVGIYSSDLSSTLGEATIVGVEGTFSTPISLTSGTEYFIASSMGDNSGRTVSRSVYAAPHVFAGVGTYSSSKYYSGSEYITDTTNARGIRGFTQAGLTPDAVIELDLPSLSGTVIATELVLNDPNRETGDAIVYDVTDGTNTDSSLDVAEKNDLSSLTANPTKIKIHLNGKATDPTSGTPSVKTYALKLWKEV